MDAIRISNLNTKFKNEKVHKNLDLIIKKGERLGIIGRNGSGKTVLLNVLAGIKIPESGNVEIDGKIGIQFQEFKTQVNLKVKDYIEMHIVFLGLKINDEINEIIDIFEITPYLNKKIKKISIGQKQRINLLLSIIEKPDILLLDEFVNGLDIISLEKIIDYINKKVMKNKTIIIVTHQPEELRNLTERIVLIKDGSILKEWKTKDIDKKYNGNFTKFLSETLKI